MTLPIQALLFDLDGTLVDSMPLHHAAWRQWHALHALPFDEHGFFAATAGRTNAEILGGLFPALGEQAVAALADEKERLYRSAAEQSLALIAGFHGLPQMARARDLKLAICTAAPLPNIAIAVERFELGAWAETIVSPADGLRGKPFPDIFEEAARRLGVPAAACLVFEDAPLGIEAARRAGMPAVALTTSLPASAFAGFDNLRHHMPDFVGFDLDRSIQPRAMKETPHA